MSELHDKALAALERSNTPFGEGERDFYVFMAALYELGMARELDGLGQVSVNPDQLRGWISKHPDELQLHSGDEGYLGRTLMYRTEFAFLLEVAPDTPRELVLFADGWNEKIRYAWREDGWDPVPERIFERHWWWAPDSCRARVSEKPGTVEVPPGDLCESVRSLSGVLHDDRRGGFESSVRIHFDDIAPSEQLSDASPGYVVLTRLRQAVERGECSIRDLGSRVDCVFADWRADVCVRVEEGRASFCWFEPRARVVIDQDVVSLGESLELLRRAATTDPYPRRRLLVTEFFDRLGSIFRVRPRDELLASRDELVATFEEVPPEIVTGWAMRCSLRLGGRPEHEAQQMREDRSAVEFLYDLLGEGELREELDYELAVEYWDEDLRDTLETANRCPIPEGTPESHWWWREGV